MLGTVCHTPPRHWESHTNSAAVSSSRSLTWKKRRVCTQALWRMTQREGTASQRQPRHRQCQHHKHWALEHGHCSHYTVSSVSSYWCVIVWNLSRQHRGCTEMKMDLGSTRKRTSRLRITFWQLDRLETQCDGWINCKNKKRFIGLSGSSVWLNSFTQGWPTSRPPMAASRETDSHSCSQPASLLCCLLFPPHPT